MILKKSPEQENISSIRKTLYQRFSGRLLFPTVAVLLLAIGCISFLIGGYANKIGLFGKIVVPLISSNIHIPINYLHSLTVKTDQISLDIKHMNFMKIAYERDLARKRGVLISAPDDWVSAKIRIDGKTFPVKTRLKGDLGDHWEDAAKWSFRVKVKDGNTILGMSEFSLQHPRTRDFLNDWLLYRLCSFIDKFPIIQFRYVRLSVNGKNLGIYLMEEFFDQELLKRNKFPDGPIVRINDKFLWYNIDPAKGFTKEHLNELYTTSPVKAFNNAYILANADRRQNFLAAKNLLESFRNGTLPTHKVFDCRKLAKLWAIIDLLGYHHTTAYSNIRFYYNPIRSLLEPIGYDNGPILKAHDAQGLYQSIKALPFDNPDLDLSKLELWSAAFFADTVFFREYIHQLYKISDPAFLSAFRRSCRDDFNHQLKILYKTFPGYTFDFFPTIANNQAVIRRLLDAPNHVLAYFNEYNQEKKQIVLEVANAQGFPIQIEKLTIGSNKIVLPPGNATLDPKQILKPALFKEISFQLPADFRWLPILKDSLTITTSIYGSEHPRNSAVLPWRYIENDFHETDIMRRPPNHQMFSCTETDSVQKIIFIKPGTWRIAEPMIFPSGYAVKALGNTVINLTDSAVVISRSPVEFTGSEESSLEFTSSDSTGRGLILTDCGSTSFLSYVVFSNLQGISYKYFKLPGAVNLYESDIVITSCVFENIASPSALYAARTTATIERCAFEAIRGTALSSVFGKFVISNCTFRDCAGGIAADMSVLDGRQITFKKINENAFSIRNGSEARLLSCSIDSSLMAITTENDCRVSAERFSILHCTRWIHVRRSTAADVSPVQCFTDFNIPDSSSRLMLDTGCGLYLNGELHIVRSEPPTKSYRQ